MASIVWAPAVNYDQLTSPASLPARVQGPYWQLWTKKTNPSARLALQDIWKKKKPGYGGSPSRFSFCWPPA
jgi:hypothetical protein